MVCLVLLNLDMIVQIRSQNIFAGCMQVGQLQAHKFLVSVTSIVLK